MIGEYIHSKFVSLENDMGVTHRFVKEPKHQKRESDHPPITSEQDKPKNIKPEPHSKDEKHSKADCHENHHLTDHLKEKLQEYIGHLDHAPAFLNSNRFIHTGYRINFHTPKKVLKSLFMVHNETVNIWSHLGGAIFLMLICVGLCFSVNSIDTRSIKQSVQLEVEQLFEPIHDRLANFSQLEHDLSDSITHTMEDITKFGENAIINLETKLEPIAEEIEHAIENITPETIGRLLAKLKHQLDSVSSTLHNIGDSATHALDKKKLKGTANNLKAKLSKLQSQLLNKIDSADLDWIDIYRYIKPDYSSSLSLKEGHYRMPVSRWPIIVFLLSAVFCLMCSATFHLFFCLSHKANKILLRLDYAGISILCTGSAFPPFVYGFYCEPFLAKLYLTIVGVSSIIVFFVSLGDTIHQHSYRKLKSAMYAGLGLFAALPCLQLLYMSLTRTDKSDHLDFVSSLPYYLSMGVCYLGGLTVYASKCPEKHRPGKFDLLGNSHQIWHTCVLLAIFMTYFGAFDNYYTRMKIPCIGCDA